MILIVLSAFTALLSYADEDNYGDQGYSAGFQAYLDGDYQSAQSYWLQSAKSGNSKSMFNLGLLHEQKKIPNAEPNKAEEWYRLAGNAGYVAADYHLALNLLKQGNKEQATKLMQRAADNDFVLAVQYLTGKPTSKVAATTASESSKGEPSSQKLSVNSKYLTEKWILDKRASYWTIQMLAFNEENRVKKFIDQHHLQAKAAYFRELANNEVFYKLVYGVYKSKVQADFARQNLPQALKQYGPWLRSIESVQTVIKAQ